MPRKVETQGEFAGWTYWDGDAFETDAAGPFYQKDMPDGTKLGAFRAQPRHMNGAGAMHGGCLMTFGDFALFMIAEKDMGEQHGVTVTFNSEFLGAGHVGELMEVTGDVLRAGGSMIFVRGLITAEKRPCMSFSGTIKKLRG